MKRPPEEFCFTPAKNLVAKFLLSSGQECGNKMFVVGRIGFMKSFLAIAIMGAALVFPSALHAQIYSINWYTIGGGGGSSSGTNGGTSYTVTGTIGQPATASMSGGA